MDIHEVDAPLSPAHRGHPRAEECDQVLAAGFILLPQQIICLVDTIDGVIVWQIHTEDVGKSGQKVHDGNHALSLTRPDVARPLDHTHRSDRAFVGITQLPAPRPGRGQMHLIG